MRIVLVLFGIALMLPGFAGEATAGAVSTVGSKDESCPICSGAHEEQPTVTVSEWLKKGNRSKSELDFELTAQDGTKVGLKNLLDRPTVVVFFFSRCTNSRKCPLAISTMANLQTKLSEAGLSQKIRLLMITYDPEFDTPAVLTEYGKGKGLTFNDNVLMLAPSAEQKARLFEELKAPVNYNAKGVNIHSLDLELFDRDGEFVRRYRSVIWENAKVLEDLKLLLAE